MWSSPIVSLLLLDCVRTFDLPQVLVNWPVPANPNGVAPAIGASSGLPAGVAAGPLLAAPLTSPGGQRGFSAEPAALVGSPVTQAASPAACPMAPLTAVTSPVTVPPATVPPATVPPASVPPQSPAADAFAETKKINARALLFASVVDCKAEIVGSSEYYDERCKAQCDWLATQSDLAPCIQSFSTNLAPCVAVQTKFCARESTRVAMDDCIAKAEASHKSLGYALSGKCIDYCRQVAALDGYIPDCTGLTITQCVLHVYPDCVFAV